jgi:hypothetical protein
MGKIPGISRDAGSWAIGKAFPAKFRGRGFSEQDGAMFSQTRRRGRILGPDLIFNRREAAA